MSGTVDRWTTALRRAWKDGTAWPWCLAVIAAACGYAVATVFHPGYLSADSNTQLGQALGDEPVNDWHPPVMALAWRILIRITGDFSTMAAVQAAVLWGTLWVLARLVWKRTGSRGLSLVVLAVGLAPHIMNLTGVVWKDVHLAYALLAVFAIALTVRELPRGRVRTRWALLVLGLLFLAYAALVRKNGIPAAIPVFALLVLAAWPAPGRRRWLAATGVFVAVVMGGSAAVNAATAPLATRVYAVIPVDDLVHVLTPEQVRAAAERAGADADLRDRMVTAAVTCQKRNITSDGYLQCFPQRRPFDVTYLDRRADVIVRMWAQQMPKHWKGYAEYRGRVFTKLLFRSNQIFWNGTRVNAGARLHPEVREQPLNDTLRFALQNYVTGFARDLPMLFQGWFWLAVSLVLVLRRRWDGPYTRELRLLGASSLLYILAYLPTAPESNYRYVYWPALSGTVALALIATAFVARRRAVVTGPAALPAGRTPEAAPEPAAPAGPREDTGAAV
ncbi:hypothetical protein [Streptomyces sp. NBC_01022]|uniref:hypothetical protein n=1 Tax=Streptomyces sp. NBC_01022 TaxID=2903723 RepID=UPI002DDA630C|nr:hypothetical protein [Streptomyces sp. NBC_01022]WRZ81506.1 hypothetical protein OG316_15125 [Streptomyces sp. NBC_01022]